MVGGVDWEGWGKVRMGSGGWPDWESLQRSQEKYVKVCEIKMNSNEFVQIQMNYIQFS